MSEDDIEEITFDGFCERLFKEISHGVKTEGIALIRVNDKTIGMFKAKDYRDEDVEDEDVEEEFEDLGDNVLAFPNPRTIN